MTHEETCWRLAELRGCKPTEEQLKRAIELDDKEEMSDAENFINLVVARFKMRLEVMRNV